MTWEIEVFYDGKCPLCMREIKMLKKLDRADKILFTDITDDEFKAETTGKTWDELMARIHGRLPSGEVIEGVEVFRQLYSAVGFGWIVKVTRWPLVSKALDWAYTLFAKNRLKLTGRCDDSCKV